MVLDGVRQAIDRFALPVIADEVELVRGTLGPTAELMGVALLVIASLDQVPSSSLRLVSGSIRESDVEASVA